MIARKNLIPLRKEFARIKRTGQIFDSASFGLLVSYGKSSLVQAAFLVSKKISLKSVIRHEVKRKLADVASGFLPRMSQNLELVFLAKQKAIEKTSEELKSELELILKRARLL